MLVPPRRFGFAAILCLLTFIALLFYFLNGTSPRRLRGPFKEPNLECTLPYSSLPVYMHTDTFIQ